ncbi:hypothetical protein HU200_067649 [Digitaria exilis]|uniref:non-specific serine/threonine protein kinase n=1 Tax=Digitaria exilis TaxID=1010633 RepID=A0A834ZYG5_9POAL|nr:hypothetical protein HU200_067649 [Digitaria exilis]
MSLLESITDNFSEERIIGRGGFADVYKALLQNGPVAVKKLKLQVSSEDMVPVLEEKFYQEICSLMMAKHKNVVRFLGYCADAQGKVYNIAGKNIVGEERQRFLCFEFLPGCLDKHISGTKEYLLVENESNEHLLVENGSNLSLIKVVLESWHARFQKSQGGTWLEHVSVCMGIALKCMEFHPLKRPLTPEILKILDELERTNGFIETQVSFYSSHTYLMLPDGRIAPPLEPLGISKLLDIFPRDLHCCSVPYELTECPVTLTNGTDFYVSVWITSACLNVFSYIHLEGSKCWWVESCSNDPWHLCMMQPHSTSTITMKMKRQWQLPKDTCDFEVLMIVMRSKEGHRKLESKIGSKKKIDSNYVKRELDLDSDSDVDFGNGRIKLNFGDKDDYLKRTVEALGGMVHRITMTAVVDKLESDIGIMVDLSRDHVNTILDLDRDRDIDIMNTIMYMNDDIDKVDRKVQELGGKVYRVMVAAVCDKVRHPLASLGISDLLDVSPQVLRCPFEPYEPIECPVILTNGTDHYVSVWITPSCLDVFSYIHLEGDKYWWVESYWKDPCRLCMMEPHSTFTLTMKMKEQQCLPEKDTCQFEVIMIVMGSKEEHTKFESFLFTEMEVDRDHTTNIVLGLNCDVKFVNKLVKNRLEPDLINLTLEEIVVAFGGKARRVMMTAAVCNKVSMALSRMYLIHLIQPTVVVIIYILQETFSMDHRSGGRLPKEIPFHLLKEITDGFSNERKLGSDTYANVYMGVNKDGEKIAVKMLFAMPGLDKMQFANEFNNLSRLQHPNIVRLVGYCHETEKIYVEHKGRLIFADKVHMALCFEYMHGGSLDMYLSDECTGLDWNVRYKIIKGICKGLKYLHEELRSPIYHLNLKPANILLDENMLPKITDFSLSRIFQNESTQVTMNVIGTP